MNNRRNLLIISIIALVITLIGSTYAFFMYSKTTKAFTLTSGDINIEFVNGDNNINLTYAYPISDNYAKTNLEKLGYIDFSVNGHITEDKKVINYEIYLEEDSKNTLDSNYIKVYLTDDTNKEIVSPTTFNSLDKTSYSNSENGKIIYKTSKKGEFNDKYRIYVWIDSKYSQNEIQERFSFKVNLYAYNDNETAVSVIKSNLVKYEESSKDTFTGGLVAVNMDGDLYNETDSSESIREYRYSGLDVNNYVTFNDEVWRIIGVFTDENNAEHVKIVRNEELNGIFPETYTINELNYNIKGNDNKAYWNSVDSSSINVNDWALSGIQNYLNTEYDESIIPNYGYLHYLKDASKNIIQKSKYYLGTINFETIDGILKASDSLKEAYKNERDVANCINNLGINPKTEGCRVWYNNHATWKGMIALLYPSDYGYSVTSTSWNTRIGEFEMDKSWMNKMKDFWFLSPKNTGSRDAIILSDGFLGNNAVIYSHLIYPTLYLKSNVKIISGDGSKDNPYKLYMEI